MVYILVIHVGHVPYINLISNKQALHFVLPRTFLYLSFCLSVFFLETSESTSGFWGADSTAGFFMQIYDFIDYPLLRYSAAILLGNGRGRALASG